MESLPPREMEEKLSRLHSKAVEINKQAGEMAAEHLGFIPSSRSRQLTAV